MLVGGEKKPHPAGTRLRKLSWSSEPETTALLKQEKPISTGEIAASVCSINQVFLDQDGRPTL
jgi:hypothetical protein